MSRSLCVMQVLPELEVGGVEQGTVEIARALVAAGHRALVVSAGGRLEQALTAAGAEHIELDVGRKHPASLRHVATLARLYREYEVDIVHARSRLPAWLAWLARRRLKNMPPPRWVTTVHGPYSVNRYSRIMVSGEAVIAISEFIRDYIIRHYPHVAPQRIHLIPRGVDSARYVHGYSPSAEWRARFRLNHPKLAGQTLLTLPARLTRWKGPLEFIRLIAELRARGHAVHGLLVGAAHPHKPRFEEELHAAALAAGIGEAVSFLGTRRDLREILAISACAFSLTNVPEAFGRTTIEALALGTPVIGYAHGGTGEILDAVFPAGRVPAGDLMAAVERTEALLAAVPDDAAWQVSPSHPYTTARMQAATLAVYQAMVNDGG